MSATLDYNVGDEAKQVDCSNLVAIGRGSSSDIVLLEHKVSRNHAIVRMLAHNEYYVIDVGSSNGTFLNGQRVVTPTLLKDGDEIEIGAALLTFHQQAEGSDGEIDGFDAGVTMTATMAPTIREVMVLVANIRGYAELSERMEIGALAKLLSKWFRAANDIIEENLGSVDKFIGDAVMARWIVQDEEIGDVILRSLRTANGLNNMTAKLREEFPDLPERLGIGVGLNTGKAAVGVKGSGRMQDFTILGDSVNLAFRLHSASGEMMTDIVMNETVFTHLPKWVAKKKRTITVKGKAQPVVACPMMFSELEKLLAEAG
jgi:adenylate cyclase